MAIFYWKVIPGRPPILLPEAQVLEYLTNCVRVLDQADNLHLRAASWADQRINLPDLFDKLPPGLGRYVRLVFVQVWPPTGS